MLIDVNNKGEDQPVLPRSLISTNVIHFMKSIMTPLVTSKGVLAIRRIFSLVDMIAKPKF